MNSYTKVIIAIAVVIVVGGGIYVWARRSAVPSSSATLTSTTTPLGTDVGVTTQGTGSYTVTPVAGSAAATTTQRASVPVPDLHRQVIFNSSLMLDTAAKEAIAQKVSETQVSLAKNPADLNGWISLGVYEKMAGDYDGARIAWQYVAQVSSNDYVSRGNLGDLYGYYLHDTAKSESYYTQAIAVGPAQAYLYVQFASFYRDVLKNTDKARAVIVSGLNKLPNNQSLLQFQASL